MMICRAKMLCMLLWQKIIRICCGNTIYSFFIINFKSRYFRQKYVSKTLLKYLENKYIRHSKSCISEITLDLIPLNQFHIINYMSLITICLMYTMMLNNSRGMQSFYLRNGIAEIRVKLIFNYISFV